MHTIYTAGYAGWTPRQLKDEAERLGALVLDIRMNPTSMRPEWRKSELQRLFGTAWYLHEPALGNRNYQRGPIELAAPERALPQVRTVLTNRPMILLCACRNWQTCHRLVAAEYLHAQIGAAVVHLEPPAATGALGTVPCLTLQQPWAWALFNAGKSVENRPWSTSFRGRLHIHTSQSVPQRKYDEAAQFIADVAGIQVPAYADIDHGKVIGSVEVTDCVTTSDSPWFFGPFGLLVRNPQPLSVAIATKGALNIWQWTPPAGVVSCTPI